MTQPSIVNLAVSKDMTFTLSEFYLSEGVSVEPIGIDIIEHPVKMHKSRLPQIHAYDERHRVSIPLKWNAPLNEIQLLSRAEMNAELYQPVGSLTCSLGCLVSSVDTSTGVLTTEIEWYALRHIEYKVMGTKRLCVKAEFDARIEVPGENKTDPQ